MTDFLLALVAVLLIADIVVTKRALRTAEKTLGKISEVAQIAQESLEGDR